MDNLFQHDQPVILVGAGQVNKDAFQQLPEELPVIGVDGGGNTLQDLGRPPSLVLGDMDSFTSDPGIDCPIIPISDQDSTDFEKALGLIKAPLLIGLGFLSDRLDHAVAALDALAKTKTPTLLIGESECVAVLDRGLTWQLEPGVRISIIPWPQQSFVSSIGLKYRLDDLTLKLTERLGSSNESLGGKVGITPKPGGLGLVMLPWQQHHELPRAITA